MDHQLSLRWAPFELERFFARYEFNVDYILGASDSETLSVGELLALAPDATAALMELRLGYTESAGSPALREALRGIYTSVDAGEILVHTGAEEAIFTFMHAVVQPGDHLIVHWPCYQSLAEVARGLGAEITPWVARESAGWALDVDELRRLLRPTTRAIILNVPHNPTGYHMTLDTFHDVVATVSVHGAWLFSDEVYRESEYDPGDRLPAACDLDARAVSLGVMSKTYGLPGLRIGWVATHDAALLARMAAIKDYTTICNAAPSEFLAALALRHRAVLVERTVTRLQRHRALLIDFIADHQDLFSWTPPGAGPIAFPRLEGAAAAIGDRALCERLARDHGVLLVPGFVYGVANHVRIGFGRRDFPAALAQLGTALQALRS